MIEVRAAEIIKTAKAWIGTPYQHQASIRQIGSDCLGLVSGVAIDLKYLPKDFYKIDPETIGYGRQPYGKLVPLFQKYCEEIGIDELSAGHIIIFRIKKEPQHCGIFIGDNRLIHAYQTVPFVVEHEMTEEWQNRITNIFRFPNGIYSN